MSALPPEYSKGFGKAVRLASAHRFHSDTTRLQAGDPAVVVKRRRLRAASLIGHVVALLLFIAVHRWCGATIGKALAAPMANILQVAELFYAILLMFLGGYAFMRLAQAALHALFNVDDIMEWPRRGVDWGKQTVVLDRDGIAVALKYARRSYPWDTMAQLTEDDVFVIDRKRGNQIVIPKDPADEDDLRERLFRGITLSKPVV